MDFTIRQSIETDIPVIFDLYTQAAGHQRSLKTVVVWPSFDRAMVAEEIAQGKQFKCMVHQQIVCVWAIAFHDPNIWEARENDSSLYIHRIATHSGFRGMDMVKKIVAWAKVYAIKNNKTHIRLDTLGNNTKLIAHYQAAGFTYLGLFPMQNTMGLPAHYHNNKVCLFEIEL